MSDLLTLEEYQGIAANLTPPTNAFINGKFMPAASGKTFKSINPATGELYAEIASCDKEDVDLAVLKGREAFERGTWSKMHPTERKEILIKLIKLMKRDRYELVATVLDVEDGVVKVRLQGACAGCPGATMTLKMGVERVLKEKVPEITRVEAV